MDVADKKADVTFNEITVFNNYNASNPGKIKLLYPKPVRLNQAAFSVAPGESELLATLNTTMHHMDNLGIINRIMDKYDPERKIYLRLAPAYQIAK
jgi:ABC-type amino acid transport substrate-binding protein